MFVNRSNHCDRVAVGSGASMVDNGIDLDLLYTNIISRHVNQITRSRGLTVIGSHSQDYEDEHGAQRIADGWIPMTASSNLKQL
jgi:hypothetical protein